MNEKNRKMMEFNIVEYTHMARLYLKILGDRMDYIQDADIKSCDDEILESLFRGTREVLSRLSKIDTECFGLLGDDWDVKKI